MRVSVLCVGLLLLSACTKDADRDVPMTSSSDMGRGYADSLRTYAGFLSSLDSSRPSSFPLAADRLSSSFKGAPPSIADSAFLLLDAFHWKCVHGIDLPDSLQTVDEQSYALYDSMLRRDGFQLWEGEGYPYPYPAPEQIYQKIYGLFTEPMQAYMRQQVEEGRQQFEDDACLLVPPYQLVDWIVWAERFEERYPNFVRTSHVASSRRAYLYVLLHGMDNSLSLEPVFDGEGSPEGYMLNAEFGQGYRHLLQAYPGSRAATLLRPYVEALFREDYPQAIRLRDDLEEQLQ